MRKELPNGAVVVIKDNGEGIAPRDLARIFELFVQLGDAGKGLGIGLALVARLVRMHGGSIEAESPGIGRGSAFTVRLPLAGADALARA